jgi:hypothetical protein
MHRMSSLQCVQCVHFRNWCVLMRTDCYHCRINIDCSVVKLVARGELIGCYLNACKVITRNLFKGDCILENRVD